MTIWVNIYPPLHEGDMPIFRRYWDEETALRFKEGCIKMIKLTF
jgi:hypothetical protein